MMNRSVPILATLSLVLAGCDGGVPEVRGTHGTVVPDFAPPMTVSRQQGVSNADAESMAAASSEEDPGECLAWVSEIETYDPDTCAFEYLDTCAEGGDIASSHTVGQDDCMGNGSYTNTYALRDGTDLVWEFTYETSANGMQMWYHGVSSEGETGEIEYTFGFGGETDTHEVWNYTEGVYTTDGRYETDGRFNGTYSFDDAATEASPDWVVDHTERVDGSFTQVVHSAFDDGWTNDYVYDLDAAGNADYIYEYDDPSTEVDPDFTGEYFYGADGASAGGYTQLFDDGSILEVEHVFNWLEEGYGESWTFDDSATEQPIDQEGSMVYDGEGNGVGTVTTFIEGGDSETCDLTVHPDGTTLVDNCR